MRKCLACLGFTVRLGIVLAYLLTEFFFTFFFTSFKNQILLTLD